jgi:hypothetical protein
MTRFRVVPLLGDQEDRWTIQWLILDEPPEFHGAFASKREAQEEVDRLRIAEDLS